MGYIDKELGIKTAKGLTKHLRTLIERDFLCVKVANSLKIVWAVGDELHTYDLKASVIYVITEAQLDEALNEIKNSLPEG